MAHTTQAPSLPPSRRFKLRRGARRHAVALACVTLVSPVLHAQGSAEATLPRVTVTAPTASATAGIAGFGDRPLEALPMQATVIDREQIEATGARRLADLLKLDAATTDAYNSPGYWDFIAVRGYTIDQRFNYRREGLPISAETAIPLENKDRVEILKGTSGIQAGTSAPGGLVNYVVKRPAATPLRSATLSVGERGSVGLAADLSGRAGVGQQFGWRLNASHEDRRPQIDDYGHLRRSVAALAVDWQLDGDALLQAEIETSHQTGASLPGYSLLGNALPAPRKPFNLNNQPWSLPNEFDALTGSLRYEQRLADGWRWVSQAGSQRLRTDDRLAFAFGCTDATDPNTYYADRYCPNGDFDLYDFRSDDERRRVDALQTTLQGALQTGALKHGLRFGLEASRQRIDVQRQAFNDVGTGNIDGTRITPADPTLTDEGTDRKERSTELFANDAIEWGAGWTTWLGLRHTRLHRESVRTDGGRATGYDQGITTPWLAASYEWQPRHTVYASWGRGAESFVVPNRPGYGDAAGRALPTLKSRQWEVGLKGRAASGIEGSRADAQTRWSLAYFDIDRPAVTDSGTTYSIDGSARHRGIEASALADRGPWTLGASGMLLDAQRRNARDATLEGEHPVNVPQHTLRLQGRYRVPAAQGLELAADVGHEGRRNVLPDGSIELPSWTRTDLGLRWVQPTTTGTLTWRIAIDNVFDRRAWKEAPTQFGHVYLYPLEARTLRLSLQAAL